MRIALVSPKWNEMVNSYPPLGLGYLGAMLESQGHETTIFDLGLDPDLPLDSAIDRIAAFSPEVVGLTAMTNNYHSAQATASAIRSRLRCPTVMGGPHATLFAEKVASGPHVDYVVLGEGEQTLCELISILAEQGPCSPVEALRAVPGLVFQGADGQVVRTAARPLIEDLDALPFPARHLFELDRYPLYASNGERMVTLLSSRGCPYNCSYCFKGIVGRTYRQRSTENLLAEVRQLVQVYGYRNLYFIDDLFTLDRRRLKAITTQMTAEGLDIRWQCLARVDRVTPDLLESMYRAGCREIHYGIESGNPDVLRRLGKEITLDQVRQAVTWTAKAGIVSKGYFMLGLPGDTEETMEQTIRFACELPLDQAMFSLTTPFPGTRLWDDLVSRQPGIEFDQDYSRAYYYTNYDAMIEPFLNVSEVSDECLSAIASQAQHRFQEARRRHKYVRALGAFVGGVFYDLSNVRLLRRIGHGLLRSPLSRRLRGLKDLGDYDWRGEYVQRWN